jgi:metal-responsive CopG/Arc/MetJ family transcriptional regulator
MLGIAMDDATKFQRLVQFRVPEALYEAIDSAAKKHFQSKSEFLRQSAQDRLRADGVRLEEIRAA